MSVLLTCQQTLAVANFIRMSGEKKTIWDCRTSCPEFNSKGKKEEDWKSIFTKDIRVPVFGPCIYSAVYRVLHHEPLRDFLQNECKIAVPDYDFNIFFFNQMEDVRRMVEELGKPENDPVAATRITSFLDEVETFFPVQSVNGEEKKHCIPAGDPTVVRQNWLQLLARHVPDDWTTRTHYSKILQLFGVSDAISQKVRDTPFLDSKMEHHCIRWLGQALSCGHNLAVPGTNAGCLTDIVNGIFILTETPVPQRSPNMELEIAAVLDKFVEMLESINILSFGLRKMSKSNFWIPKLLIHDAEADDIVFEGILRFVCGLVDENPVTTVVQLPKEDKFDKLASYFSSNGICYFRDPDSRNQEALIANWKSFF